MNYIKQILYGSKIKNLIDLGMEYFEEENYLSAITFFSHALELDDSCQEGLFLRGKSFFLCQNYKKAETDFEKLIQINKNFSPEVFYLLTKIELNINNPAKAAEFAKIYYNDFKSDDTQAQYFLARALYINDDFDESINLIDLLILNHENSFELRYLRSLILFSQSNYVSAILDIDEAIKNNPNNSFAFNMRALIHIELSNFEEAIHDFSSAIKLNPLNPIYFFNRSKTQLKIGDLSGANVSIEKALEIDSMNKSFLLLQAEIKLLSENISEALEFYMKAYKVDEDDFSILKTISHLKMLLGDFEGAKIVFNEIKSSNEISDEDYYFGAFLDYQLNNENESIYQLKNLLKDRPENSDLIYQLGILSYVQNKYSEAFEMLNLIPLEDSKYHKATLIRTQCLSKLGDYEEVNNILKNTEIESKDEIKILLAQNSYNNNDYKDSLNIIDSYLSQNVHSESIKLLKIIISICAGIIDDIDEINENEFSEEYKKIVQVLNGLINFEKGQYYSAKYRLLNIEGLSNNEQEFLKPLLEFADSQIS